MTRRIISSLSLYCLGSFLGTISITLLSCTTQLPGTLRLAQQDEIFQSSQYVNTKLDLLWVIDNSGSMDVSQKRIRDGFEGFARKYMKPTWDIRVAVITTDTYLANPAFQNFLNNYSISPANSFRSSYLRGITANGIPGRATPFVNPAWAPNLVDMNPSSPTYGKFVNGLKFNQERPTYNLNWAKLLPGYHDGPITTLCHDYGMSQFINPTGVSRCYIRDNEAGNTGPNHCAEPGTTETSESQCVNTFMNNSVRSGKPIISTLPPLGIAADEAWTEGLIRDFLVNLSPGISGWGYERALGSLQQLLADNEAIDSPTKFFRKDSLRAIILVGDENDQTMVIPSPVPNGYGPNTDYLSNCNHNVDGVNFSLSVCPNPSKLVPVSQIKTSVDQFFRTLDGHAAQDTSIKPNYFIAAVVAPTASVVQQLRSERGTNEIDRADRFIDFANQVGNGSLVLDISSPDYSPILDAIGQSILMNKATFELTRAPTNQEEMLIQVLHADGSSTVVLPSQYSIDGKFITITDLNFLLTLSATDQIRINYQPKTLY